jgi:pimeloyl-ACP methyl ester carboxylesterase
MTTRWAELDLELPDGRGLHAYDTDPGHDARAVMWHHGTPNIGLPPEPLFAMSEQLGVRWVSYDRPGYGGSTRRPGRDLAAAAADAAAVADALRIERFAVMGHSGGGSHALAVAALLPERVLGAVSVSGLAPYGVDGLDWFAGMADPGVASLRAALAGREAKERYEAGATEGDPGFIAADMEALAGEWSWFGKVVGPALAAGMDGLVDDDLAYVAPWACDPSAISVPTLIVHGDRDRIVPSAHGEWLERHIPGAECWLRTDDGHISVLRSGAAALEWLVARVS